MQDIHDIKPLVGLDFPWFPVFALLALLAGLLIVAIWLYQRWRRRKKSQPAPAEPPVPRQDPRVVALQALKELKPEATPAGQFYLQLEKLLKEFLEAMHEQPVTGFTAQQLMAFLQYQTQVNLQEVAIDHLLQHGQQAKFAAMPLTLEQMRQDLSLATRFVENYTLDGKVLSVNSK